jgi:hypothetical protein
LLGVGQCGTIVHLDRDPELRGGSAKPLTSKPEQEVHMATVIVSNRPRKPTSKKFESVQKPDLVYYHKVSIILTKGSPELAQTLRELIDAFFEPVQRGTR